MLVSLKEYISLTETWTVTTVASSRKEQKYKVGEEIHVHVSKIVQVLIREAKFYLKLRIFRVSLLANVGK